MNEVFYHEPVLLNETMEYLLNSSEGNSGNSDKDNAIGSVKRVYVDCTLGGGGYTKKILSHTPVDTIVVAIDRDVYAVEHCKKVLSEYSGRVIFMQRNFGDIKDIIKDAGYESVNGIVMDLGLSTYQLSHEDGFSYQADTPLDMRADKDQELTASDVLNAYDESELAGIFYSYGEMRYSRQIAKEIVLKRKERGFKTTFDIVELLRRMVPPRFLNSDLSKLFQAIRIEVNNELGNLEKVLKDSTAALAEGGRIAAVSYHSLEDRIVKNAFREDEKLRVLTKKPIEASEEEIKQNVRSRSAKLRAAEKNSVIKAGKNKYMK